MEKCIALNKRYAKKARMQPRLVSLCTIITRLGWNRVVSERCWAQRTSSTLLAETSANNAYNKKSQYEIEPLTRIFQSRSTIETHCIATSLIVALLIPWFFEVDVLHSNTPLTIWRIACWFVCGRPKLRPIRIDRHEWRSLRLSLEFSCYSECNCSPQMLHALDVEACKIKILSSTRNNHS